eukprot:m.37505 g.37505  ORF g.37505 m.37505 type:complete len:53 (-) comp14569_c0_seq2:1034-1192(-)
MIPHFFLVPQHLFGFFTYDFMNALSSNLLVVDFPSHTWKCFGMKFIDFSEGR